MEHKFSTLKDYWEYVAKHSFHLKMKEPAISDDYYRSLVYSLLGKCIINREQNRNIKWVLKFDAYNEATHTKYAYPFLKNEINVILTELSHGIISKAVENVKKHNLHKTLHPIICDFRYLPLRDSCVDFSCSFGSVEHVPEWYVAMWQQVRVVKINGLVVIAVPNLANIWLRSLSARILHVMGLMSRATNPEKHFLMKNLRKTADALGLRVLETTGYFLFPKQLRWLDLWLTYNGKNHRFWNRIIKRLLYVFYLVEQRWRWSRYFAEMIAVYGVVKH